MSRLRGRQTAPAAAVPFEGRSDLLAPTRAAFAAAADAVDVEAIELRFAGRHVAARVAGPLLAAQLRRTFASLLAPAGESAQGDPELRIHAWDRAHAGVGCPGIASDPDEIDAFGSALLSQFDGGNVLRVDRAIAVSAFDRHPGELFHCVRNAADLTLQLQSKPFPELMWAWYRERGVHHLHAGLVARGGRGVLLSGPSGSGKTTAALACSLAGFDFLGDDHVGIEISPAGVVGHSFYSCIRADGDLFARFPELGAARLAPVARWERKGMVCIADLPQCRTARAASIAAVIVLEVRGTGRTRLRPLDRATALRKLAPSSLLVPLGGRARGLAALAELVRKVPCHGLELGASLEEIPAIAAELTSGAR